MPPWFSGRGRAAIRKLVATFSRKVEAGDHKMLPEDKAGPDLSDRTLVITRTFDAPRELVFDTFTDPRHLARWWGPKGCAIVSCEATPVVGGTWRITMRTPRVLPQFVNRFPSSTEPAAHDIPWIIEKQRGVYREVERPDRLVFSYIFEDDAGHPLHQTVVTITFTDEGGQTRLTLRQSIFENVSVRDDHVRGWTQALDRLGEHLMPAS